MDNKKIKIHVKNNHGRPGTFPSDQEGEKNFTITKEHIDKALEKEPQIKEKVNFFIDWDEEILTHLYLIQKFYSLMIFH